MTNTIAIVGAGIAGLMAARALREKGASVVVLEKSRGVGGRMATKRVGGAVFDQGAQFFTAREEGFVGCVREWEAAGVVARWAGEGRERWIGGAGMTAVAKFLSDGLVIERERKVTAAMHVANGWELAIEGHGLVRVERLVLTAPVPQSLALLAAGGVRLPDAAAEALAQVEYHPCLALLVALDGPSAVPAEGIALAEGPLRWVADNAKKGISAAGNGAVTLHATPEFSTAHYGRTEGEVATLLLPAAREWLGGAKVISATLHRWRYSEVVTAWRERCVWWPELALGMAGDAFGGARVEGAALSGLAIAARIGETLSASGSDEES